jgi:ketosteroid isomerase-like protein
MDDHLENLTHLYRHFNERNVDAVLAHLASDIAWANGMDGGHVHGHDGIREYWARQWSMIDPHVEPLRFEVKGDGSLAVEVQHTVRDLSGNLLEEKMVGHIFHVSDGKITRFDIRGAS